MFPPKRGPERALPGVPYNAVKPKRTAHHVERTDGRHNVVTPVTIRYMPSLSTEEAEFLRAVSRLAYANPFLPECVEWERAALGGDSVESEPVWSLQVKTPERPRTNIRRIAEKLAPLIDAIRDRLVGGAESAAEELTLYEDAVLYLLYQRYYPRFFAAGGGLAGSGAAERLVEGEAVEGAGREPAGADKGAGVAGRREGARDAEAARGGSGRWRFYNEFLTDWQHFFRLEGVAFPSGHDPRHTFACFRQIQRAFEQVFGRIIGGSMPSARLRAAIWQSIFTHDMRRYRRTLYARMGEFATLITGPSGTGKELAARAIGESRYVPFDERRLAFAGEAECSFFPINISALSPTLVESELFGHLRGSFTGALATRKGWLETCPELGSVFLDEIGDLDTAIQVKMLRVIETRTFHPVGGTGALQFRGKLITATNRDLETAMRKGQFREDLYYRLCSDQIATPSLAEQLTDSPAMLGEVVYYMARRLAGAEAEELACEVTQWIETKLGPSYGWPGNYRELEQCVKNFLIRRNYRPFGGATDGRNSAVEEIARDVRGGRLTADDLLTRYITLVYSRTRSYEETGRRLGIDRRTVKAKVDRELLGKLELGG